MAAMHTPPEARAVALHTRSTDYVAFPYRDKEMRDQALAAEVEVFGHTGRLFVPECSGNDKSIPTRRVAAGMLAATLELIEFGEHLPHGRLDLGRSLATRGLTQYSSGLIQGGASVAYMRTAYQRPVAGRVPTRVDTARTLYGSMSEICGEDFVSLLPPRTRVIINSKSPVIT